MTTDHTRAVRRITPATPSRRITWFTLLGLVLVPLAAGGVLLAGLWDPTGRLDQVTAAVVNEDQPVELDGQTVPLGRQLAAGLVDGGDENYTWVLTDAEDAAEGVADGAYAAVVTIPSDFSAAATSPAGDASAVRQATIDVTTADRSKALDDALTAIITTTARQVFNRTLTTAVLDNLYLGFSGVQDALAQSADGAGQLQAGSQQLADGTTQLADGAAGLAGGVQELASGADELAGGVGQVSSGVGASATGAAQLASGAGGLATGARTLATSAGQLADATAAAGAAAATTSSGVVSLAGDLGALGQAFAASCQTNPTTTCQDLAGAFGGLPSAQELTTLATAAGTADAYLNGSPASPGLAAGSRSLASGAGELASGAQGVASGAQDLSTGLARLRTGAASAASGAQALATGVDQTSAGADELSAGAAGLTGGAGQLRDGAQELAAGLTTAAEQVPSFSEGERTTLSRVAAEPLAPGDADLELGGVPVVALLAAVALWLGGLATWLLLAPVPPRALGSTRSSLRLAAVTALPGVWIGLAQGLAVGLLMLTVLDVGAGTAVAFVAFCALTGVTCALAQHGLAGLLGGVGRFIGVLIGAAALAAGVVSTSPAWVGGLVGATPVGSALAGVRAVASGDAGPGVWTAMLAWCLVGLALSVAATARARSVRVGQARSRAVSQLSHVG